MKLSFFFSSVLLGTLAATAGSAVHALPSPGPRFTGMRVFEAVPPYKIQTKDGWWNVKLAAYPEKAESKRRFDFIGPFINSETDRMNAMALQTPYAFTSQQVQFLSMSDSSSPKVSNAGSPGRIAFDRENSLLRIAYHPWDPPSPEKCRVMINSWPIPTHRMLTWDLSFKAGGRLPEEAWPMKPATVTPKLLWQIKNDNDEFTAHSLPSMGFFIDTDSEDSSSLRLTFFQRLTNDHHESIRWSVGGLTPGKFIDVVVQAGLDDRAEPYNTGILKVWVNGKLLVYRVGRNLLQQTITSRNKDVSLSLNRFAFGVYMMSEADPSPDLFVTHWRRARMLVSD